MDEILQLLLGPFGTLVLSLVILVTGWKRMWVFGWHYQEEVEEKKEWKEIALRGTRIAEKSAATAEKAVTTLQDNGAQ